DRSVSDLVGGSRGPTVDEVSDDTSDPPGGARHDLPEAHPHPHGTIGPCAANSAAGRSAADRTPPSPAGSSATAPAPGCRAARPAPAARAAGSDGWGGR